MLYKLTLISIQLVIVFFFKLFIFQAQNLPFSQDELDGIDISIGVNSMMHGPDGRLYAAEYSTAAIKAFTIQRNEVSDYEAIDEETLDCVRTMANHNDDGTHSIEENPTHTFSAEEVYDVTITVEELEDLPKTTTTILNVNTPPYAESILINAGGPSLTNNGEVFEADQHFVGGSPYSNTDALVSELYLTERSSSTMQFAYDIPISNGDYEVKLYFAEIFWGATGKPAGGMGKRVFDVSIEGTLILDDYDIYADVGAEVPVIKTFSISISDGSLNIDFSSLPEVGGVNEPKISAIEILPFGQFSPIVIDPIVTQNNLAGDNIGSLAVSASGGDSNTSFSFEISGQPNGLEIDPTEGLISGTVDASALTGGPNNDGVHNVLVMVKKTGSLDVGMSFIWSITDPASCIWNDLADSGPGRFESLSQAIGDKLYITGGWISRIPPLQVTGKMEIYDTNTDTWSLGTPMPIPVTHMGNTVVGDEIWSVGGFAGNDPGVATDLVQIYNTTTDTWSSGPSLPIPTGSGALVLIDNKLHYFGGLAADRLTDIGNHYVLDLANVGAGWSTAALMPNPRNHFSGIALDGIIYAIGGDIGHDGPVQNTKFLHSYDAVTNQWTRLADLPFERSHFEPGTAIHNGKIIIVGGRQTNAYFDNVTQFDPQSNTWSELCKLPEKLLAPTAKVLDNQLIVTGGGVNGFNVFSNATRWLQLDPVEEPITEWINKDEDENYTGRHENAFVQAGDKFYLFGGRETPKNIDVFDYSSNSWSTLLNSVPLDFNHFQAIEYQGLIWVLGAFQDNNFPNEAPAENIWVFDPSTEEWIQGPQIPLLRRRGAAGLAVYNDKFYLVGGNINGHNGGYVAFFDEYDPATGSWSTLTDAPRARDHFNSVVIGNNLFVSSGRLTSSVGGYFSSSISEVDVYNFSTATWSTLPSVQNIPTERAGAAAVNFNDNLVVIGGEVSGQTSALSTTEQYNPVAGLWTQLPDLISPRHGAQAIVSGNGIFIASGSPLQGGGNQKNMEVLGVDSPLGVSSVTSTLTAPNPVMVSASSSSDVNLNVSNGNTGIIIKSMMITGPNASSFILESGDLNNGLLKANTSHIVTIGFIGSNDNESATLTVNYGNNSQITVSLISSNSFDSFWLEAECAIVGSGWSIVDDSNASNGQYLRTPLGNNFSAAPSNSSSIVTFEFQADAGQYSVYTLTQAGSLADDSFWVRANNGTWVRWNFIAQSSTFIWDRVDDSDNSQQPVTFDLLSGINTIEIAHREDGVLLDKLYVTSATDLPTGLGDNSSNCEFNSQPPVANAGADQNITILTNNIVLDGSESNDPDGGVISAYAWVQQSGPSTAILNGATSAQLTVSNLEEGDYVFQLTVTDDESDTDFDDVTVSVTAGSFDSFWLEAECAIVGSGWSIVDDSNASNGQYLQTPSGNNFSAAPSNSSSIVTFEFQADAGQYSVYTLTQADSLADDSFWVRANNGTWVRWNFIAQSSTFIWDRVDDSDNSQQPVTFDLLSGINTIEIAHREDGVLLDKLYVTSATDLPTGLGDNSSNCASSGKSFTEASNNAILTPNPSSKTTTLSFDKPVELVSIEVFDVLGKLVTTFDVIEAKNGVDYLLRIDRIPTGSYFLKSRDENGKEYQKLMVIMK